MLLFKLIFPLLPFLIFRVNIHSTHWVSQWCVAGAWEVDQGSAAMVTSLSLRRVLPPLWLPSIDWLSVFSCTCSYGGLKREERSWSHFAAPIFVLVFSSLFLQTQLFLQTKHSSSQPLPFCHSNPSSSDLFFILQGKYRANGPGSKYILHVLNYYYLQTGSAEPHHLLLSLRIWFLQTPLTFAQSKSHIWVVHKHKYLYELSRMSQFSF